MKKDVKKKIIEEKIDEKEVEEKVEPKVIEDILVEEPIAKKTKVLSDARLQAIAKANAASRKKKEIRVVKDEVQFQQFQKWLKQQNKEKMLSEYSQIMDENKEVVKVKPFSEPTPAPFNSHRFL